MDDSSNPTISGPPRVIGWDERTNGARLEVPVSMPLDKVWMAASEIVRRGYKAREENLPHGVTFHADMKPRVILSVGQDKKVDEALSWLDGHLRAIGDHASRIRREVLAAEEEAAAWFKKYKEFN